MKLLDENVLYGKKYIIFDLDGTVIDSVGMWNFIDYLIIEKFANVKENLSFINEQRSTFIEKNYGSDIYVEYCGFLIDNINLI